MILENRKQKTELGHKPRFPFPKKRGFTIIEMLTVAAIFSILTAIIIFNYGDFTDNILSTNMAYEIALTARQAQVFGVGARGQSGAFTSPYGIFINTADGSSEDGTKNVIFFADSLPVGVDTVGNGQCNTSSGSGECVCTAGDECLEKFILQRNIYISTIEVKRSTGSCVPISKLSVTFKRPNPDALIVDQDNIGVTDYELAEIAIVSPNNSQPKYVIIRNTGQISVSTNSECD